MSDIDGAAAPAEGIAAPAPEVAQTPNPVTTEAEGHAPEPEEKGKPEPKAVKTEPEAQKPLTTREALQKAAEKVEKDNAPDKTKEVKTEAKPDDKAKPAETKPAEVKRDETGKFAPKDDAKPLDAKPAADKPATEQPKPSHTAGEPPARFSQDAKAAWATAPESVRAEVSRMERELTAGFEKHRAAAERDASLNEFHEMAKQSGKDLPNVVREYVAMENHLRKDLVGGLNEICQRVGVSLKDVAAHVMGQTPDQNASAQDATIRELREKLAAVEQQVGSVTQTFQQQQEQAQKQREEMTLKQVQEWSADKPLFELLSPHIADEMRTSGNSNLDDAYNAVLQKHPQLAALSQPAASSAPAIDLAAQTAKGQKSINGAPTPGSDPAARQPSKSIKESIRRAVAQAG